MGIERESESRCGSAVLVFVIQYWGQDCTRGIYGGSASLVLFFVGFFHVLFADDDSENQDADNCEEDEAETNQRYGEREWRSGGDWRGRWVLQDCVMCERAGQRGGKG